MVRWFFILAGTFVFMASLAFFLPKVVFTPAFALGGYPFYWGFFETALVLYIGHRTCK